MISATLLIHGPRTPFTHRVIDDACRALRDGIVERAVFSGYPDDVAAISAQIARHGENMERQFLVIGTHDVQNPGIANLNRQINLVNAGLARAQTADIIIKLRSDQRVTLRKCRRLIDQFENQWRAGKLITTTCYTRSDRLYHPSDMFLMASPETLHAYYPTSLYPQTELDDLLAIRQDTCDGISLSTMPQWPESRLFRHLLMQRGWPIQNTAEDSLAALHQHCVVLDARQIGLHWEKFYRGRLPLVPYRFRTSPFPGMPAEDCACWRAADFGSCSRGFSRRTEWLTRLLWHPRGETLRMGGDWRAAIKLPWKRY